MPIDDYKRLELHIEYRANQVSFRLFEFRNDLEFPDSFELAAGFRIVSESAFQTEANGWQESISALEDTFKRQYLDAYKKSRAGAEANGKKDSDSIHAHVLTDPAWEKEVIAAAQQLVDGTGKYLSYFSEKLLNTFFPEKTDKFWRKFNDIIDKPTREALRQPLTENIWLKVPLLQLRIDEKLLAIPWWITRTHDLNSLWCCRYALAVSPSLRRTHAPNIQFSTENPLRILTVTRPTFDLKPWFPISKATAEKFSADNRLVWRMVDGILEFDTQPLPDVILKGIEGPLEFHGVDINMLERSLEYQEKSPNLIFYQGHWRNKSKEPSEEIVPFIILHDPSPQPPAPERREGPIPCPYLPVPLLDVLKPKDHAESVLIMNACNSAGSLDQATYIQDYIEQHSVFIGASYPIVAYVEGYSIDVLLRNITENRFLAHSLLEANKLEKESATDFDSHELYRKAALCLFGDVRAHLFRPYDPTAKDNLTPIELVLTDRWKPGFEKLGLSHSKGMTYRMDTPIDHAPTDKFALTDKGVQIALTPLSIAIDLCRFDRGNYRIIGPAFTSKGSVAVVSVSVKDIKQLQTIIKARPLKAGILAERLTTTFMLQQFILNDVFTPSEKPASLIPENLPKILEYHHAFSQGAGSRLDMLKAEFLDTVDITLILNEDSQDLRDRGLNVIADDLETQTANRLHLKTNALPRGIFLTRRKCLENEADRASLQEFCDKYNERVGIYKQSTENRFHLETPNDIPLYTYNRSDLCDLESIKLFAETSFFGYSPFSWDNFAYVPVITHEKASSVISGLWGCLEDAKSKSMSRGDKESIGVEIRTLEERLAQRVGNLTLWPRDDFQRLIEEELNKERAIIKDGIRKGLLKKLEDAIELKLNA